MLSRISLIFFFPHHMSLPRMSELFITFFPIFAHHRAIPSLTLTSSAFKDALSATEENPDDCTLCLKENGRFSLSSNLKHQMFCFRLQCPAYCWSFCSYIVFKFKSFHCSAVPHDTHARLFLNKSCLVYCLLLPFL